MLSHSCKTNTLRLSDEEIKAIRDSVDQVDDKAKVILFGSRTDKNKKGGDIDLLMISDKIDYRTKRKIRVELFKKLGDRKIDIIVTNNPFEDSFTKTAYENGIEL